MVRHARTPRLPRSWADTDNQWIETSHTLEGLARVQAVGSRVLAAAVITRVVSAPVHWAQASFLYRWLTADPEPEVIVIDLRETVTVGPLIAGLERGSRILVPAANRSKTGRHATGLKRYFLATPVRAVSIGILVAASVNLAASLGTQPTKVGLIARVAVLLFAVLGTQITISWEELLKTTPVQLVIAVLEPPPAPENSDEPTERDEPQDRDG